MHSFLPILVNSKYSSYSLEIINTLLHLRHSTYNLVKCELVDLIASINFKALNYAENLLASNNVIIKHQIDKHNDLKETNFIEDDSTDNELFDKKSEHNIYQDSQTNLIAKNIQVYYYFHSNILIFSHKHIIF